MGTKLAIQYVQSIQYSDLAMTQPHVQHPKGQLLLDSGFT